MNAAAKIDPTRVTLSTETERLYWETKLGAQRGDLADAIRTAGPDPAAIARWLERHRRQRLQVEDKPHD